MKYEIIDVRGHYEIYINGNFYCSADTYTEAIREINNYPEATREMKNCQREI